MKKCGDEVQHILDRVGSQFQTLVTLSSVTIQQNMVARMGIFALPVIKFHPYKPVSLQINKILHSEN
jgi:hypothetical protein